MLIHKSNLKIYAAVTLSLLFIGLFSGCGADTVADMNARTQERDREASNYLCKQYEVVKGVYRGSTKSADIYLSIDTTQVSQDGASTPQCQLAGSFTLVPKIALAKNNSPVQNAFPFINGKYDNQKHELSFSLEKGTPTENTLGCKADKFLTLTCKWDTSRKQMLTLKKTSATSIDALNTISQTDEVYTGTNTETSTSVVLEFRSGMRNQDGSQIAIPAINGSLIVFDSKLGKAIPANSDSFSLSSFKNAIYSSTQDVISFSTDDDPPIPVDCTYINADSLSCSWVSNVPQTVVVRRTVRK